MSDKELFKALAEDLDLLETDEEGNVIDSDNAEQRLMEWAFGDDE